MYGQHAQQQDENQLAYAPFLLDLNAMHHHHHHDSTQGLEIKYMDMLQQNDGFDLMLPSQSTDFSYYEALSYPPDDTYPQDSNTTTPYDPLYQEEQQQQQQQPTSEFSSFEQSLYSFYHSGSTDTLHAYQHPPPVSMPPYSSSSCAVAAGGDPATAGSAMIVPPPLPSSSSAPALARYSMGGGGLPSPLVSSSSSSSLSSSASYANHGEPRQQIYVRKACVSCKQSHVACDVQRPCARCVRLNKADTCVDAERKKRGRPCGSGKKKRQQQQQQQQQAAAAAHAAAIAAAAATGYPRI